MRPRGPRFELSSGVAVAVVSLWWACWLVGAATAAEPDFDEDFCSQSSQALTVAEGKLYINGGWQLWRYGSPFDNYTGPVNFMRTVDVTKEFRVTSDINGYAPKTELPSDVPRLDGGAYWPTEDGIIDIMLGAQWVKQQDINDKKIPDSWYTTSKRRYHTDSKEFTKDTTTLEGWTSGAKDGMVFSHGTAWVPRRKMGFFVGGGWYDNTVTKNGEGTKSYSMLIYEHEKKTWTNESLPHRSMENVPVVHLAAGDDDLIIALGSPESTDKQQFEFRVLTMRTIHIYSVKNRKWYKHTIPSGASAPQRRGAYCAAIVSAPDNSSHQIIIMGGVGTAEGNSNLDGAVTDTSVWALNIPSMQWTQLPGTSATDTRGINPGGRNSPACTNIGHGFILFSGGRKVITPYERPTCDTAGNNIFLFNANLGQWVEGFNTSQTYEVPEVIRKSGSTSITSQPSGGYTDSELNDILKFPVTSTDPDSDSDSAFVSDPVSPTDAPSSSSKKSNTIAIAVGTSVGVVGAIIIVAVILWEVRRRRKKRLIGDGPVHMELPSQTSSTVAAPAVAGGAGYHQYGSYPQYYNPHGTPYDAWPKTQAQEQDMWQSPQDQYPLNELPGPDMSVQRGELPGGQIEYMEMAGAGHEPVEAHGRPHEGPRSMDVGELLEGHGQGQGQGATTDVDAGGAAKEERSATENRGK